jgi:cell filamentation protein
MKQGKRYDTSGLVEAQFEPGSRSRVLRNLRGIKSSRKMDDAEASALQAAMEAFVAKYDEHHRFTDEDICDMHRRWLGGIYTWAGTYRQVNVSKDGFPFAAAGRVPALMEDFSRKALARRTPCRSAKHDEIASALAETHVELVLIHPFREGNGRIARALATLMALQAGLPLLDFSLIAGRGRNAYFAAVQAGMDRNYEPMAELFAEIIDRSLAAS